MFKTRQLLLLMLFTSIFNPVFSAPNGEDLYTKHCSICHNDQGVGGIGLPLNGTKIEYFPRDYLFKTIRLGRVGRVMPAFDQLSDAQINAIVDYVLSWKQSDLIASFDDTPVKGNPRKGKKLYKKNCAECHGKNGKSSGLGTGVTLSREREFDVVPPALNNAGFLASAKDEWIKDVVVHGRPGTTMPSKAKLNLDDDDVNNIVSYIRSYEQEHKTIEKPEPEPPTLEFDSPYDFITTISNIKQSLQGMNFRYFPDRYIEMGLADDKLINKKQLSLRFCNFNQLYSMINTEPRLGVILPCRITVVEQDNGEVKLYIMNMKVVTRLFNNEQLSNNAEAMLESIIEVIEEATL